MKPETASLWAYPAYMKLWFARVTGVSASQMLMVAVAWQMYDLTNSAWDLGLVGLLQFAPSLLLTLPAGHLIDRLHRGRVSAVNSVFIGASNQLGEFESGATAALIGPVGSVLLGGVGTLVVAGLWLWLFPALAQRDALVQAGTAEPGGRARA
jgi:hypothetical protein